MKVIAQIVALTIAFTMVSTVSAEIQVEPDQRAAPSIQEMAQEGVQTEPLWHDIGWSVFGAATIMGLLGLVICIIIFSTMNRMHAGAVAIIIGAIALSSVLTGWPIEYSSEPASTVQKTGEQITIFKAKIRLPNQEPIEVTMHRDKSAVWGHLIFGVTLLVSACILWRTNVLKRRLAALQSQPGKVPALK